MIEYTATGYAPIRLYCTAAMEGNQRIGRIDYNPSHQLWKFNPAPWTKYETVEGVNRHALARMIASQRRNH